MYKVETWHDLPQPRRKAFLRVRNAPDESNRLSRMSVSFNCAQPSNVRCVLRNLCSTRREKYGRGKGMLVLRRCKESDFSIAYSYRPFVRCLKSDLASRHFFFANERKRKIKMLAVSVTLLQQHRDPSYGYDDGK